MDLSRLLRITGWVRITFAGLSMLGSVVRTLLLLRAGSSDDMFLGQFTREVGALAISGVGALAGNTLREVATKIDERRDYASCQSNLVVFGMLALCDCGWLLSAPVSVYALIRLRSMRGEFSEAA